MDPQAKPATKRAFSFNTSKLAAYKAPDESGVEQMFLKGTASSTVRDRQGDTMTAAAQAQMVGTARGMTMFLNHSYEVPEDIAGKCASAALTTGSADGQDVIDLEIACQIDPANERAVKCWNHVNGGTQLGFSIGGRITDAEVDVANDKGDSWMPPLLINGLELLEISVVGIPANPRAYTKGFVEQIARSATKSAMRSTDAFGAVVKSMTSETTDAVAPIEGDPVEKAQEIVNNDSATEVEKTIDGAVTIAKGMSDEQCSQTVSAMKCIKSAVDHGACPDTMGKMKAAHATMKAMLPDDYDTPDDAELDQPDNDSSKAIVALGATAQEATAKAEALAAQLEAAKKLADDLTTKNTAELTKLNAEIETLKATPTGKRPVNAVPGGSSGGDSTLKADPVADLMRKPSGENWKNAGAAAADTSDARTALDPTV